MTTLDQAVEQMRSNGMPEFPGGLPRVNTPRIIRYGPKNKAWYRLHEFVGRTGQRYIAGAYGMWGALDPTKIEADWTGFDEADRARIEREQAALEQRERDKRERLAKAAALRGKQQYRHALDIGPCPYLDRKGVRLAKPLKVMPDGTLVVPMWRYEGEQRHALGVQKILPDGTKRFNKGADQRGACCVFGTLKDGAPIVLTEGVATGLSIREAEPSRAVVCAFNAGNLQPVAELLRSRFPASPIVLAADDDWRTVCDKHQREGRAEPMAWGDPERPTWCHCLPGRFYAERVAEGVPNVRVVLPDFGTFPREPGDTDFNDLHRLAGLDAVRAQLAECSASAPKAGAKREKKKAPPPADPSLLDAWTLIRSSDMLFDRTINRLVRVSHARLDRGDGLVKWWLAHPERKSVWAHDVVFEPAGCEAHQLNLFRGFERKPDASRPCARLLELLQTLCGEADQDQAPLTDWVLRWLAYPLQHPGAKMQTALVFHGDEGTGKNLFFGTVREIYGSYGGIVTQSELESDFNAWASQKLFLIANEVVSRMELRHQTGRLKNLITEATININEKMLPLREEGNHIQFVFLSNETQPLILGPNDRRYVVIQTPPPRPKPFYASVREEIDAGGVEGLYAYLMALDLGDFSEHADAPLTDAKVALQELGMNSAQTFAAAWRDGLLEWPFVAARSQDVYRGYQRWCARSGERMPMSLTRFSAEVAAFLKVRKQVAWLNEAGRRKQATVFLVGTPVADKTFEAWLSGEVLTFSDALRAADNGDHA